MFMLYTEYNKNMFVVVQEVQKTNNRNTFSFYKIYKEIYFNCKFFHILILQQKYNFVVYFMQ